MQSKIKPTTKKKSASSKKNQKLKKGSIRLNPTGYEFEAANLATVELEFYRNPNPWGQISKETIRECIEFNLNQHPDRLKRKLEADEITAFESQIIQLILQSARRPDSATVDFLYTRMVGRVENKIEVTHKNVYESMTDEELAAKQLEYGALQSLPPTPSFIDVTPKDVTSSSNDDTTK